MEYQNELQEDEHEVNLVSYQVIQLTLASPNTTFYYSYEYEKFVLTIETEVKFRFDLRDNQVLEVLVPEREFLLCKAKKSRDVIAYVKLEKPVKVTPKIICKHRLFSEISDCFGVETTWDNLNKTACRLFIRRSSIVRGSPWQFQPIPETERLELLANYFYLKEKRVHLEQHINQLMKKKDSLLERYLSQRGKMIVREDSESEWECTSTESNVEEDLCHADYEIPNFIGVLESEIKVLEEYLNKLMLEVGELLARLRNEEP